MAKKIPTKDIYLCELLIQSKKSEFDDKSGEWCFIKSVYPYNPPKYILAYKDEYGYKYIDIFNKNEYILFNNYDAANGEIVVAPIKPIFFDKKKISIEEAQKEFSVVNNREKYEDEIIMILKNMIEDNPLFAERIRNEALMENTSEEENTEVEEKGKVRKFTK